MLVGGALDWPAINANLDFMNHANSYQSGFKPTFTRYFEANGSVTVVADLGLPVSLGIGIDILKGKYSKEIDVSP